MTRINVGIQPVELTDQHLIAEHREIKRIPNCVAKGKYNMEGVPDKFKLGTSLDILAYMLSVLDEGLMYKIT